MAASQKINDDVIPMSPNQSILQMPKETSFKVLYVTTKSYCPSFNGVEVLKGGGGGQNLPHSHLPTFRNEKKPRLNWILKPNALNKTDRQFLKVLMQKLFIHIVDKNETDNIKIPQG